MIKKILITGGAGFIGSHIADFFVNKKYNVTAVDDLSLGKKANISHLQVQSNFKFVQMDVLDDKSFEELFAKENFTDVFHFAANSDISKSHDDPSIDLKRTFMTTISVLEMMRRHNVRKIVFASSSAICGEVVGKISENHAPCQPVSHYGACKLASEALISSYVKNYDMQSWILRFPNVVGERATHGVIFDFIKKLQVNPHELIVLGDGKQCKPYLYVKDLVEAIVFVWENANAPLNVYCVGVDSRTTVANIAKFVVNEMGLSSKITFSGGDRGWIGDVPEFEYDLSKIHSLGWKASSTSDDAVRKATKNILKSI